MAGETPVAQVTIKGGMPPAPELLRLKARYVFPIAGPPLADGLVTIRGERIESIGPATRSSSRGLAGNVVDLGNAALLPGLVNAHTHLEASDLPAPLGEANMAFPQWIRRVIEYRAGGTFDAQASIVQGLAECVRCGTTTLGEIAVAPWTEATASSAQIDVVAFLELMGLSEQVAQSQLNLAREYLREPSSLAGEGSARGQRFRRGLSPHAPYTAGLTLVAGTVELARSADVPVAMHLAESPDELEFLATGAGPIRTLLEDRGKWLPDAVRPGAGPLEYLRLLAAAPRSLVIHGNYLDDEEIAFVAAHAARMSVVYCPRTHAYFGHGRHPLARLLHAGANVCLGTDSRGSNPDLSLLEEMRFVARHFPELPPPRVLGLGTCNGAQALGFETAGMHAVGTIGVGQGADLMAVALPDRDEPDPHLLVLDSELPAIATWVQGRRVA
jgi:aminodeoxyfutalosine deaminase